mgnify:CR=1 FL=1
MNKQGTVYFFTGLSGAGKSTIGGLFYQHLLKKSPNTILLDGDVMRRMQNGEIPMPFSDAWKLVLQGTVLQPFDYTREGRLKGAWVLFRLCKYLADQGRDVVCCSISMYREIRKWNRENILNYREIYVKASMETLYQRDQKGLYSSHTKNVVGVDIPAEEPENPDIVVQNDGETTPEEIVERLERQFGL